MKVLSSPKKVWMTQSVSQRGAVWVAVWMSSFLCGLSLSLTLTLLLLFLCLPLCPSPLNPSLPSSILHSLPPLRLSMPTCNHSNQTWTLFVTVIPHYLCLIPVRTSSLHTNSFCTLHRIILLSTSPFSFLFTLPSPPLSPSHSFLYPCRLRGNLRSQRSHDHQPYRFPATPDVLVPSRSISSEV